MLWEVQAAALLQRCETLAGRRLEQVRGNLRNARTRAEAVWELIVAEAVSQLGPVELDPPRGGPDVRLRLPSGRHVSIETTYLRPRFEEQERLWHLVHGWVADLAHDKALAFVDIECRFDGDVKHPAGPQLQLPGEHEKRAFLKNVELLAFFAAVTARPDLKHTQPITGYTLTLMSSPNPNRPIARVTSGGRPPESPKNIEEHAAYRSIKTKLKQHKVDEPHLVCIGSDTSFALSSVSFPTRVPLGQALARAVSNSGELSGVLVVHVESKFSMSAARLTRFANFKPFQHSTSRYPLSDEEWQCLRRLDFNRWEFGPPLLPRENPSLHRNRSVPGPFGFARSHHGATLKIPATLLVDVLAGRKELMANYSALDQSFAESVYSCLDKGWTVVGASYEEGDIQRGQAAMVILEVAPSHDLVYWPGELRNAVT